MKKPSLASLTGPKSLGFAYPSSPNAVLAHKPKGCWVVFIGGNPVSFHDTKQAAIDAAKGIDLPWDYYTPVCWPEVLA